MVRERQPQEARSGPFLIYDLEGELFFGAAPELDRYLPAIFEETERYGIRHVVLRFRRARNPDAGAIEHLERFLRDANALEVTVLLAGARPDFVRILRNVRITKCFSGRAYISRRRPEVFCYPACRALCESLGNPKWREPKSFPSVF